MKVNEKEKKERNTEDTSIDISITTYCFNDQYFCLFI